MQSQPIPSADSLASPGELRARLPLSSTASLRIARTRQSICDILDGSDRRRLLAVVGPCSLHSPQSALEYAKRLRDLAAATCDELVVVMRTYLEKPRTTVGWKGLLNDPDLDGSCDLDRGLELSRALLVEINELGLPCASELLDPLACAYIDDLLSWAAVGARTCESQPHRALASGLGLPVGFKNPTSGALQPAIDAVQSARGPHAFLGMDAAGRVAISRTHGNAHAHLVLRGGAQGPNFELAAENLPALDATALARPLVVDCSHANSAKDPARQADVLHRTLAAAGRPDSRIAGIMLESHLMAGRQDIEAGREPASDRSLTDACIGWAETEALIGSAARHVAERP